MVPAAATLSYIPYITEVASPTMFADEQLMLANVPMQFAPNVVVNALADEYTVVKDRQFAQHFSKLNAIQTEPTLWPENAPPPNREAINGALEILHRLEEDMLRPSHVVASAGGGVAICFVRGAVYADIECFNDGAILGVTSDRHHRPIVWEVEPSNGGIARASSRIRRFLVASATQKNDSRKSWR